MNGIKIVILGKSGCGKSSLGNTILGKNLFEEKTSSNSEIKCQEKNKLMYLTEINQSVTIIETPGFFDVSMSEEDRKQEIVKYMIMCSPGVHVFLIVLEVGRYTDLEKNLFEKILKCFSEEALRHAIVVFTHGDGLQNRTNIEDFAAENKDLRNLVKKCGCRCFVVDNKYWTEKSSEEYRSNKFQIKQLFKTINAIRAIEGPYTNAFLQDVGKQKTDVGITEFLLNALDNAPVGVTLATVFGAKTTKEGQFLMESKPTAT